MLLILQELATSIREQTKQLGKLQEHQHEMVLRLERIEAKETSENVARLQHRVEQLELDRAGREGSSRVLGVVMKSPLLAWIATAAITVYTLLSEDS